MAYNDIEFEQFAIYSKEFKNFRYLNYLIYDIAKYTIFYF